jgi:aspartyl-tRNA(Asn)/glutamyl-tRNA(Gln) amidotransferase subunit A
VSDAVSLSARDLLVLYRSRELSPVEVVAELADRIAELNPLLGAFTTLCLERARREAQAAEREYRVADRARPLLGVPFGVKDTFDSEGVRTTYGSPMFADHVPTADAAAVRRAREAGAILLGKTQTHEFAWGITSVNRLMGTSRNPWALDRISGGSSGGSAVALAARLVPLALGSDTGGSIRVPSALCGTVGLKPTWGRISAAGVMPLARSLDHPGPMARTPGDAALLLAAVAGVDAADPATENVPLGDVAGELERGFDGLRVGLCPDLHLVPLAPDLARAFGDAVAAVQSLGAETVEVAMPEAGLAYSTFVTTQRAEALQTHREQGLYPARSAEYGDDVRGRLEAATAVTVVDYLAAAGERQRLRAAFARVFREVDLLLTPVGATSAPLIGRELDFRELTMPYTVPQDLAGLPACAVRAGFDALRLPMGVQFTGPLWSEARVLRAAQALYTATPEVQDGWPVIPAAEDAVRAGR